MTKYKMQEMWYTIGLEPKRFTVVYGMSRSFTCSNNVHCLVPLMVCARMVCARMVCARTVCARTVCARTVCARMVCAHMVVCAWFGNPRERVQIHAHGFLACDPEGSVCDSLRSVFSQCMRSSSWFALHLYVRHQSDCAVGGAEVQKSRLPATSVYNFLGMEIDEAYIQIVQIGYYLQRKRLPLLPWTTFCALFVEGSSKSCVDGFGKILHKCDAPEKERQQQEAHSLTASFFGHLLFC